MNIPTAEIYINEKGFATWYTQTSDTEGEVVINSTDCYNAMIEFAQMHVKAQTEAILERLARRHEDSELLKHIVINSHPLYKIK